MKRGRPRHDDILTPREWEVLALVEQGWTNEEIAERLGISTATAKFHVSEILTKLNLPNRRQAGAWRVRRLPAALPLIKGGAWLAATAAAGAIIFLALWLFVLQDSRAGTSTMGKVAYVVDGDVWVKQLPNGPVTQLTKWGDVLGEPQWSASGEWLSVARRSQAGQTTPGLEVRPAATDSTWIIDANGRRERQIGDEYVVPVWSPVKDEYLVGGEIHSADGSSRRMALAPDSTRLFVGPGFWTPSGEWLVLHITNRSTADMLGTRALVRVRPDGTDEGEIYRIEISECEKKRWLTREGSCQPSPLADGDEWIPMSMSGIVADTRVIGVLQTPDQALLPLPADPVKTIPLDASNGALSGGIVSLGPEFGHEYLAYSPVSGRLAAVFMPGDLASTLDARIALLEPGIGVLEYVTALGEAAGQPAWSADGRMLLFTAADSSAGADPIAGRRIWSVDADGSNRKQLTSDPRYRDEFPRMTADGTQVLFTRIDLQSEHQAASLWLLDMVTGEVTIVADNLQHRYPTVQSVQVYFWSRMFHWWQPD